MLSTFRTVNRNSPSVGFKEMWEVLRVLRSGGLAQGARVASFEEALSEKLSPGMHAAVNSGTSALISALSYFDLKPDDEVIVPSFTFAATANAVVLAGGKPVFAEVDPLTYTICTEDIKQKVNSKTVGILPVHLFGLCADMQEIKLIADHNDLFVVEDAAQAHLATIAGKRAGTFGDAGCFSFYPTKNMTSIEGGSVVSNNLDLITHVKMLRNQGMLRRYENEIPGFNFRMTEVSAAVGDVQLNKLAKMTKIRKCNAQIYIDNLKGVTIPIVPLGYEHVYHQFTIRVPDHLRPGLKNYLNENNVLADVYYPTPVHRLKPYFDSSVSLPVSDQIARECLSLPVGPRYTGKNISKICELVNYYVGSHG